MSLTCRDLGVLRQKHELETAVTAWRRDADYWRGKYQEAQATAGGDELPGSTCDEHCAANASQLELPNVPGTAYETAMRR